MNRWQLTGNYVSSTGNSKGGYTHLHPQCRGCQFYLAMPATVLGKFDLSDPNAAKRWWFFPQIQQSQTGF